MTLKENSTKMTHRLYYMPGRLLGMSPSCLWNWRCYKTKGTFVCMWRVCYLISGWGSFGILRWGVKPLVCLFHKIYTPLDREKQNHFIKRQNKKMYNCTLKYAKGINIYGKEEPQWSSFFQQNWEAFILCSSKMGDMRPVQWLLWIYWLYCKVTKLVETDLCMQL